MRTVPTNAKQLPGSSGAAFSHDTANNPYKVSQRGYKPKKNRQTMRRFLADCADAGIQLSVPFANVSLPQIPNI